MRLEGRADREPELELALRLQRVVEHAASLRVHRKNEAERNVQHRHEEPDFGTGRRLEILQVEALPRYVHHVQVVEADERPALHLVARLHLSGVVEQNEADRAGNRNLLLDVEVEQLVAAENQAGDRIGRSNRPDVESAYAVLAPEEQLLENRQIGRALELVDVLVLPPKAERQP